jgi:hypothetical protein
MSLHLTLVTWSTLRVQDTGVEADREDQFA